MKYSTESEIIKQPITTSHLPISMFLSILAQRMRVFLHLKIQTVLTKLF